MSELIIFVALFIGAMNLKPAVFFGAVIIISLVLGLVSNLIPEPTTKTWRLGVFSAGRIRPPIGA